MSRHCQIEKPKRKDGRRMLQAKNPKGAQTYNTGFVHAQAIRDDLAYIWGFADKSMDLDLSIGLILHRAVTAYRQMIMTAIADWHEEAKSMEPQEALDAFNEFVEFERYEILHLAGKKGWR